MERRFRGVNGGVDHGARRVHPAVPAVVFLLAASPAAAYVGPGAGIAFVGSAAVFLASFLLAILLILFWPLRRLYLLVRHGRARRRLGNGRPAAGFDRVVIVGLDGMDPRVTDELLAKGVLPTFAGLRDTGCYRPLGTGMPSISPVVWSTFATGASAARHAIFDFFTRDPHTYQPVLSSVETRKVGRRTEVLARRRGRSFWSILGEAGIPAAVLRVPITFPPEKFEGGRLLSAMCVPDLRGTQGSFSSFTGGEIPQGESTGGARYRAERDGEGWKATLAGPEMPGPGGPEPASLPFTVRPDGAGGAILLIDGQSVPLALGRYTPWVSLVFRRGRTRARGIARFLLRSLDPDLGLYVTPVNLDPAAPIQPISHPYIYAPYLAAMQGPFATLGLAEDTWALNERVLDEDGFLGQVWSNHAEREAMFFRELAKTPRGLVTCVFDATDRVQHMFWRYRDPDHPALRHLPRPGYEHVIEDLYRRMDDLVARVLAQAGERDLVMVISDHGFSSFRRGFNANAWLRRAGYLVLREGAPEGPWFAAVDWSRTRAYALGLGGIYLNLKGREGQGIVAPGAEAAALKKELAGRLTGLWDEEQGRAAIVTMHDLAGELDGPYTDRGPELVMGFDHGYRVSWDAAVGNTSGPDFEDNLKSWSGDHAIDPALVPGVLFCNRAVAEDDPAMVDIGPTILDLFGLRVPSSMEGRALTVTDLTGG